jgi:CheY-like chemotaxis protein
MLVDDMRVNRDVLGRQLSAWGMNVTSASSGAEALQLIRDASALGDAFEMAILDHRLPEMDGFEATAEIRNLPGIERSVPIVALTTNAVAGDAERCLEAGMDGYLSKPVKFEQALHHARRVQGAGSKSAVT